MKRLHYYQVHKNKSPRKKKRKEIELGIKITYCKGSDFHQAFVMDKKQYTEKEISHFILQVEKHNKKEKYLKRIQH